MTWISPMRRDLCGGSSHSLGATLSGESADDAQVPGMLEVSGAAV
jgi:hypothetical protein